MSHGIFSIKSSLVLYDFFFFNFTKFSCFFSLETRRYVSVLLTYAVHLFFLPFFFFCPTLCRHRDPIGISISEMIAHGPRKRTTSTIIPCSYACLCSGEKKMKNMRIFAFPIIVVKTREPKTESYDYRYCKLYFIFI